MTSGFPNKDYLMKYFEIVIDDVGKNFLVEWPPSDDINKIPSFKITGFDGPTTFCDQFLLLVIVSETNRSVLTCKRPTEAHTILYLIYASYVITKPVSLHLCGIGNVLTMPILSACFHVC